jgi:quinol monooxygenase YgiN
VPLVFFGRTLSRCEPKTLALAARGVRIETPYGSSIMVDGPCMVLHLRIRCDPNDRKELLRLLNEAMPFYEQPGGIRIRLLEDTSDPSRFIEIVEYESQESYERDQSRVENDGQMQTYLHRWRSLLSNPVEVEVYKEITTEIRGGPCQ